MKDTESPSIVPLGDIAPGSWCEVVELDASSDELFRALLAFGIVVGTAIEVRHVAPLNDPITIALRGFALSLRRSEAAAVRVKLLDEQP